MDFERSIAWISNCTRSLTYSLTRESAGSIIIFVIPVFCFARFRTKKFKLENPLSKIIALTGRYGNRFPAYNMHVTAPMLLMFLIEEKSKEN